MYQLGPLVELRNTVAAFAPTFGSDGYSADHARAQAEDPSQQAVRAWTWSDVVSSSDSLADVDRIARAALYAAGSYQARAEAFLIRSALREAAKSEAG